jgi:hypothetical protein
VHRFVDVLEDTCLSVEEGVLPVIFCSVEQEVRALPESRLYRKFFSYCTHNLELLVGHQENVSAAKDDVVLLENDLPDVNALLDLQLPQHFSRLEVVLEDGVKGSDDELVLGSAVEEPQNLHLIREPQDLLLVLS